MVETHIIVNSNTHAIDVAGAISRYAMRIQDLTPKVSDDGGT